MLLIPLLLSFCVQTPAVAETFPAVGSEAGITAQNRFRSWLGAAAKAPLAPLHAEYQVHLNFSVLDSADKVEAVFEGTLVSDVESSKKMHHHLSGVGVLGGEMQIPVEMNFVMNNEDFWFYLYAAGLPGIPDDGFYLAGKISALQELYRAGLDFQKYAAGLKQDAKEGDRLGLGPQLTRFFMSLPSEASALGQPSTALFYLMSPFSCRSFELADGDVIAHLGLDTQPEAYMVEWTEGWDLMWADMFSMFGSQENGHRTSTAFQSLGDYLSLTLNCDYTSGTLLGLKAECHVNLEQLGLGTAEEAMDLEMVMKGHVSFSETLPATLFTAPLGNQTPMDINAMLSLALAEVHKDWQELKDEADAEL